VARNVSSADKPLRLLPSCCNADKSYKSGGGSSIVFSFNSFILPTSCNFKINSVAVSFFSNQIFLFSSSTKIVSKQVSFFSGL
jgi:hypothetical protein